MAPNGYLHAGAVVALADTACGYGCILSLPDGAHRLHDDRAEDELPAHARSRATIDCEAKLAHGGRTTQLWDATVSATRTGARWRSSAARSSCCASAGAL